MLLHAYGLFQSIAHAFEPYGRTGCPRNASLDLLNTNKNATAKGGKLEYGAAGGDRTHDPWLRRPILYPLSYSRISQIHLHYLTA